MSDKPTIGTPKGPATVARPTLRGWKFMLGALPRDDYSLVQKAILRLVDTPDIVHDAECDDAGCTATCIYSNPERMAEAEREIKRGYAEAGGIVLDLIPRVPDFAAALCAATMRDEGGMLAFTQEEALVLDDSHVFFVIEEMTAQGIMQDFMARVKNLMRRRG